MEGIFGLWKEYGWIANASSILNTNFEAVNTFQNSQKIIDYLKAGKKIMVQRGFCKCPVFKDDIIHSPSILTDGEFSWTKEYIHYLTNGRLKVDEILEKHIIDNNYSIREIQRDKYVEIIAFFHG